MAVASAPLDWLVARPIAHRGLHDLPCGITENTLSAARAALEHAFSIECDVQLTSDDDVVVFHDFDMERLTGRSGEIRATPSRLLQEIPYRQGTDTIARLADLLDVIGGRVPLVCELKSRFDGDLRLVERVTAVIDGYRGPLALKSFDPQVIAALRNSAPCPLGIVAEANYDDPEWDSLSTALKRNLGQFLHFGDTRPDFLSYHVGDLPHAVPYLCRTGLGMPVMTWTVRRPDQRAIASRWADQIIFEGFHP